MKTMIRATAVSVWVAMLWGCATSGTSLPQPAGLFFRVEDLSGVWAESINTQAACDAGNSRMTYDFSPDGRRVRVAFDPPLDTPQGPFLGVDATIVSSTPRTLIIRYDGEERRTEAGQVVEWELSIAAPGVYRWRETSWDPEQVNIVVGIRCAP